MPHRIWAKILTWGVLLTPITLFVYRQKTVYPLIFLKTFVFQIAVELLFLVWLWLVLRHPEYRIKIKAIHIAVAVWIAILILTAFTGVNIEKSFWSTQDRSIGIIFVLHVFAFSLMLQTVAKGFGWRKFMTYMTAVGVGAAGMAVVNHLAPKVFYAIVGDRPAGTFGNPSFLAGFLLFTLFIAGWLLVTAPEGASSSRKKSLWPWTPLVLVVAGVLEIIIIYKLGHDDILNCFGIALIIWGLYLYLQEAQQTSRVWNRVNLAVVIAFEALILFLANTRGAILALVLGLLILLVWYTWRDRARWQRSPAAITLILLTTLGILFTTTRSAPVWQKIPGFDRLAQLNFSDSTVGNRAIVWGSAIESFKERPLLGWGTDNFRYAFDLHYKPILLRSAADETYWDKPHNVFLESLVTTGVIGFAAYMAIFITLLLAIFRTKSNFKPFGYAILVAYTAQNFVIFDSFGTYLMFFVLIAFIIDGMGDEAYVQQTLGSSTKLAITIPVLIVSMVLVGWLSWTSGLNIYGNSRQYLGLNYFVNRLPVEAVEAYKQGFALRYPYSSELRQSYVASLKQMIGTIEMPRVVENIQLAIDEFKEAVAQDPNNHFLYYTMADARTTFYRVDKKFLSGAEEEIDMADKLSPGRQQIHFVRSRIKLALGDNAGGLAEMQKAVDLEPSVGEPHFYHAILSVGTASIDAINRELVVALDAGYRPKSLQEMKLLFNYFMLNEQYALGSDYFSELLYTNPNLVLEQQLYRGELSFKATMFDVALSAFGRVKNEFSLFLLTDRFKKDYQSMFQAVGIDVQAQL